MSNAIVLAAGKGTRMKSEITKTMHCILGKPMVSHIYDTLKKVGVENVVFVVSKDYQQIENHLQNKVDYAIQEVQLGSGHAVMQAECLKGLQGKTFIINGDEPLISIETYKKLLEVANQKDLVVLTMKLDAGYHYGRIIRNEKGDVAKIVEYKDCNEDEKLVNEVNTGIYCVDNVLLWEYLPEIKDNNAQHEFYITDLVEIFNRHHKSVGALIGEDNDELLGINNREELIVANKNLQKRINHYWLNNGVTIINPENTYIGIDVEIGKDTIIYPNVRIEGNSVIGKNNIIEENSVLMDTKIGDGNHIISSRIVDSSLENNNILGPNAHLRNNCRIGSNCRIGNFVEMKNVIFGDGSKCAHLTYIGDANVGKDCNFGCGVVTVNYDGHHKYHTEIKDHVFVGSNVNIIAPVTIEEDTVLAAGSTITYNVKKGDLAIGRVRQVNKPGYGLRYLNKK